MKKPLRARYQKIETITEKLLTKYKIETAPVAIDDIAKGEGAELTFENFNKEVSGVLFRDAERAIIAVEKNQHIHRRRFTVAHELGHLLLHPANELRVDKMFRINRRSPISSTGDNVEEIEANAFAAAMLMPTRFLTKDLSDFVLDMDDSTHIQKLAKRYEVSPQAMTIRLLSLLPIQSF